MRFPVLVLSLLLVSHVGFTQSKKPTYQYSLDLTKVVDDKVYVELVTPKIQSNEITFSLPKMIPGTYAIEDFGRFISDFHALDKKGADLPFTKVNDNEWKISQATRLAKITYWVEDTYDSKLEGPSIFEPAGTNIEEGKDFIVNNGGYFGYFAGLKDASFVLNIYHDQNFYGATGMIADKTNEPLTKVEKEKKLPSTTRRDTYITENYDRLVDSPLMYAKADTAIIKVGNAEVLIASYSPTNKVTAKEIATSLKEVLTAQSAYLGGKLPVDKYAFIFYFTDKPVTSYGALEHSYSSFYFMPESTIGQMEQQLRDFASHEFFHIVTPLTIHSEQIQDFDFNKPEMSKHLWLYEGVTEYFAGNMQVQYGLITPEEYLQVLRQKLIIADGFLDTIPFTEISKKTLDEYKDQYYNVYQKGALIGLCLDIQLRQLSGGNYGLRNLIFDLSKKFGKAHAFKDDELFAEITTLTYPQIGDFLKKYVGGPERLPLESIFNDVGVNYLKEKKTLDYSLGITNRALDVHEIDGKPLIVIANPDALDVQGKSLDFHADDAIVKINGEDVPPLGPEVQKFFKSQRERLPEIKEMTYTVLRKDASGKIVTVELKAPVQKIDLVQHHLLSFDENADAAKLKLRKNWLSAAPDGK